VARIFVSYRRDDSAYAAVGIAAGLARSFGSDQVFLDSTSIQAGGVYPATIRTALRQCAALVAVIGPRWMVDRRIDDPRDWVRVELRTAFDRGIPVVPVLLDTATLPTTGELPHDVAKLALSQYRHVRGASLDADVDALAQALGAAQPDHPKGTWHQYNQPRDGGVVYASQGTQNIISPERR
jgi:hypothetical protein